MFQNLKKSWNDLSDRDRKILTFGSVAVLLILLVKYALLPYLTWREDIKLQLKNEQMKLEKMVRSLNNRFVLEQEKQKLDMRQKQTERGLIQARDADLASAEIIKTLRQLAQNVGISTSRISSNKAKDMEGLFQEISLSIPSMQCSTKQFFDFLLSIKKSPEIFSIKELRIRVPNIKEPGDVTINLDISGFMVKPTDQTTDSGTEKPGRS
ncbi:type II secretion system protein M [bacterium]|nr:type II secretion system protein M [bacterium]